MEYRNLLNFVVSLLLIFSLFVFVPPVNDIITAIGVTLFAIKLAEGLMEITRKYFLQKRISPKNRVVLITGCDTGFGNLLARRLDKIGYSVLATCLNPDGEGARKLTEDCSEKLTVLPMDVTDERSIGKVKTFVEKNLEPNALWAVVNNAGIAKFGLVEWTAIEEFQSVCDVNTFGALRVVKTFLPFVKQSKGRIVNVTSTGGHLMLPWLSAYCLSKYGAVALSTALQIELPMWGVKCINIEPFMYATQMADAQSILTSARNTWDAAPTDVREEYGKDYFEAAKPAVNIFLRLFTNSNVYEVVDCLEDAITAEDPLPVYVPANLFLRSLIYFYQLLPLGMKERFLYRLMALNGKPLALKMKKGKAS